MQKIWIPYVIYLNTDNNEAISIDATKTTVAIKREGDFIRSSMDVVDEIEVFDGDENQLTLNQTYTKEFHCTYMIHYFPFDTQVKSFSSILILISFFSLALLYPFGFDGI